MLIIEKLTKQPAVWVLSELGWAPHRREIFAGVAAAAGCRRRRKVAAACLPVVCGQGRKEEVAEILVWLLKQNIEEEEEVGLGSQEVQVGPGQVGPDSFQKPSSQANPG